MKGFNPLIYCFAALGMVLWFPGKTASAQSVPSSECGYASSPQALSTVRMGDRILIGEMLDSPYIVLLTYDLQENLPVIRTCISDAFLTSSSLGRYIHIASFDSYSDARELAKDIRDALQINVRIIHQARLGR